jgi:hypothetical protein
MFSQEKRDVLGMVLRFANNMMHIWCTHNLLVLGLPALVVLLMNMPDMSLTSLNCFIKCLRLVRVYLAFGERCSSSPLTEQ